MAWWWINYCNTRINSGPGTVFPQPTNIWGTCGPVRDKGPMITLLSVDCIDHWLNCVVWINEQSVLRYLSATYTGGGHKWNLSNVRGKLASRRIRPERQKTRIIPLVAETGFADTADIALKWWQCCFNKRTSSILTSVQIKFLWDMTRDNRIV